jgi:hypothetical protein
MTDNLVRFDVSRFSKSDVHKVQALGDKLKLMRRWFRCERQQASGHDRFVVYSGDRGPTQYAVYHIVRNADGGYALLDPKSSRTLASARTVDVVIDALPNDFYYSAR